MGKESGSENVEPNQSDSSKTTEGATSALINDAQPEASIAIRNKTEAPIGQGNFIEQSMQYPVLNAIAVRGVYFGVQGRLFPSMDQIRSAMLDSGQIGQAAVNRMDQLGHKGWSFGALGPSDSFITRHVGSNSLSSIPKRLGMSLMLGGYNDSVAGRITHNAFSAFGHTMVGFSSGADRDAANKYIHELTHGRSSSAYEKFEATPGAKQALRELPEAERLMHGKRMVEEELRSLFAQVAANNRSASRFAIAEIVAPHSIGLVNMPPEQAIKQGDLGRLVRDVWVYDGPKSLSIQEANKVANDYIKTTYGSLYLDGKLNPSAEAAVAREIAELEIKAPLNPKLDAANHLPSSTFSPRYAGFLSRGAQALGSFGLAVTVSDLRNQYSQGFAPGTGRLLSVGTDWAGFEAGLAVGSGVGKVATGHLLKINPKLAMVAAPLTALGAGLLSTHYTHELISSPLERATKNSIDKLLH